MIEGQKFARKCSVTGEGMNEGWLIDGEYFSTIELAHKKAQSLRTLPLTDVSFYDDFYHLYKDCSKNGETDFCYYTEWYDESDYQYIVKNGELVEID